jgi:L-rhamnose isomerase
LFYAYFQTAISNNEDLKKALETYASSQRSREFGYAFDAANPRYFTDDEAATLVRNSAFTCLQEADADMTKKRLAHFITNEFFE